MFLKSTSMYRVNHFLFLLNHFKEILRELDGEERIRVLQGLRKFPWATKELSDFILLTNKFVAWVKALSDSVLQKSENHHRLVQLQGIFSCGCSTWEYDQPTNFRANL